jgi:hypothetical protein
VSWLIAVSAIWLLPGVLILLLTLVVAVRERCLNLVAAIRRRQVGRDLVDERGTPYVRTGGTRA